MSAVYKRTITTFLRVVAAGSFNKAAESANLTAAAVIKQINQLEGELRFPLFHRTHRGLTLTEAGRLFADEMKTLTEVADQAVRRGQKTANPDPVIHVGTSPMTPAGFLMPLFLGLDSSRPCRDVALLGTSIGRIQ